MTRLFSVLFSCILFIAIIYDLKYGTIPVSSEPKLNSEITIPYEEVLVKNGDTLLSIIENREGFPKQVDMKTIVEDFQLLNNGLKPDQIQPGKIYKIPIYHTR